MFSYRNKAARLMLVAVLVVVSSLVIVATTLAATTVTWSGDLVNSSDGTFTNTYCSGTAWDSSHYQAQQFWVDADGSYTMEVIAANYDTWYVLYENSFDPANPMQNCIAANDDYYGLWSRIDATLTARTQYILVTTGYFRSRGTFTNQISGPGNITLGQVRGEVRDEHGFVQFEPNDGRMNHSISDRAAPVAAYCQDWGIEIWQIDPVAGVGINPPAIYVSWEEIEAAGVPTGENLLLAENNGVAFYRLTTGEYQVNTTYADGKLFILVWNECDARHSYHLAH